MEIDMLLTLIANVQRAFKKYMEYRTTVYELNRLTDRDLHDLGINRCDIEFIARKNAGEGFGKAATVK
jgi:uncharacterized protein YjiS (DUF1127 family)